MDLFYGMDKYDDLFVALEEVASGVIAFLVVNFDGLASPNDVILFVFGVFDADEAEGKRHSPVLIPEIEQTFLSINPQKLPNFPIVRYIRTQPNNPDFTL